MASNLRDLGPVTWRKSSYSNGDGGHCLEVAEDFPGAALWRKSIYSSDFEDACVEVAHNIPGLVPVRDSKAPQGPALILTAAAWAPFVSSLKG
ncbi:DUF397 domain-containing protein [Streptomyces sp. NPDC001401]|uniref:DUF397 domain-containing protein n=1 Tax=Streptomyces sp. NPDC001401 TaxID=3364570 RepID=UPI0036C20881